MSSQIVFLFDLDQCLPLEQPDLNNDDLEFLISKVKDICLRILVASSHLDGPNSELRNLANFSFRFYSSTEYFMVPDQHEGIFQELHEETFDLLETALSDRFEALLQTSKTNSFNSQALQHHIRNPGHKAPYLTLQKALEEITILYNWDRPLMHSPVKSSSKATGLNSIYVFTYLPDSHEDLCRFMGKAKAKRKFSHKDIFERVFNTHNRTMMNVLKGDSQIGVNIIDTAGFRQSGPHFSRDECFSVKSEFKKCLFQIQGNVLPIDAFRSKNCSDGFEDPHPISAVLNGYTLHFEKQIKSHHVKMKIGKENVDFLSSHETCEELRLETLLRIDGDVGMRFDKEILLWTKDSCLLTLSHFMLKNKLTGIVKYEDQLAILIPVDGTLFHVKVLCQEASKVLVLLINKSLPKLPSEPINLDNIDQNVKFHAPRLEPVKDFFDGNFLETATIPKTKPFENIIKKANESKPKESDAMEALKKSYLPHQIEAVGKVCIRRKTSEESISSSKSSSGAKSRSRGAELLRLGSKNAELRRHSSHDDGKDSSVKISAISKTAEESKEQFKSEFMKDLSDVTNSEGDSQTVLRKLTNLQLEMLDHGENFALVAFAEVVADQLMALVKLNNKTSLEDIMKNFLVDPSVVSKRKGNKAVRIRDHKLQVLFRVVFHRLILDQEALKKMEDDMLAHLRQISIWDSPHEMLTFLQEVITTFYVNRQPELLCILYEELNQPPPPGLSALFSPFKKSEVSSPDLSSITSQHSDVSYISNPSWRPRSNLQDDSQRATKVRRPQNFNNRTFQIDLRDKKQGKLPAKPVGTKGKTKTPKRRASAVTKKTPVKKPHGVRRNLSFDDGSARSSPRKKLQATTPRKGGSKTPKKTPKKQQSKTPCKMTPGKRHQILVPETPTGKGGRRKSDGTQVVNESPNIDALKQGSVTPRALSASVMLQRRSSFYSGEVSRNILAAEEEMNARHLQNFNTSLPVKVDGENISKRLFPHMEKRQRRRSTSKCSDAKTPKKDLTINDKQPEIRRSMRRLFEDADDPEISLKSPFKVPPPSLFSPSKSRPSESEEKNTPRKRRPSSSASTPSKTKGNVAKALVVEESDASDDQKTSRKQTLSTNASNISSDNIEDDVFEDQIDEKPKEEMTPPRKRQRPSKSKSTPSKTKEERPNEKKATPKKQRPSSSAANLTTPVKRKDDVFDKLVGEKSTDDENTEDVLQTPPPNKTYLKKEILKTPITSTDLEPSTPSSRPNRRKKFVERMGIDDVKLADVLISPRVCITPFAQHKRLLERKETKDSESDEELAEPLEDVKEMASIKPKIIKKKKTKRISLTIPKDPPMMRDISKKRKRNDTPKDCEDEVEENEAEKLEAPSPVTFKYDVKAVESPNGEFKLRINRTLKPINTVQRISRRASLQLGISPEKLLQLQTKSPSPMKKLTVEKNKENVQQSKFSPLSSASLYNLTTSPILNMPKERRPSKDSPSRKRRRVSKKLYD